LSACRGRFREIYNYYRSTSLAVVDDAVIRKG